MVRSKIHRDLQQRYEKSIRALLDVSRQSAELTRRLDLERTSRENAEKRAGELELRIKSLTRTIADVEEILHDA